MFAKITDKKNSDQDWILGVCQDGSVVIWRVTKLFSEQSQQQMPSVSIWHKLKPLPQEEAKPISISSICHGYSKDSTGVPSKISLFIQSRKGAINAWNIVALDTPEKSRQYLISRCWGHQTEIKHTISHPSKPFYVTIDISGSAIFWKLGDSSIAEPNLVLSEVCGLNGVKTLTWLAHKGEVLNFVAILDSSEVSLFQLKETQDSLFQLKLLSKFPNEKEFKCASLVETIPLVDEFSKDWNCIVAIVEDHSNKLHLFRLNINEESQSFDLSFSSQQITDQDAKIMEMAVPPTLYGRKSPIQLITSDDKGNVSLWKCRLKPNGQILFNKIGQFAANNLEKEGYVKYINAAYFGRFATSGSKDSCIKIWELESSVPHFKLETTIETKTLNTLFQFLPIPDGNFIFAVGDGNVIQLFSESEPNKLSSFSPFWKLTHQFSTSNSMCKSLAWNNSNFNNGTLVVGTSREVFVFTKWLDSGDVSLCTIYHKATYLHSPLPLYHPKVLTEMMMSGEFAKLEKILRHLLDSLESIPGIDSLREVTHLPSIELSEIVEEIEEEHKIGSYFFSACLKKIH